VDKPERTQAQVVMGQLGLDQRSEDFPAFLLANDAFGIGFSGRLMKEVRVKRGWSYYAYSYPSMSLRDSDWVLGLAPGAEHVSEAVTLVLDMVAQADKDGFTDEEVDQVRSARLKSRPFLADTARKRLELEITRRVLAYDRLAATAKMESIKLSEVNAAFSELVEPDHLIISIVGTASEIQEKLEETFGPIEVVSYEDF